MSQTKTALKKIASGEEYKTIGAAVENKDYEAMCDPYIQISALLVEEEKKIKDTLENLPWRDKAEVCQKFQSDFYLAVERILPLWHRIDSELKKLKITESEVFGFGSKGDPLVRTPEGRIVVLRGPKLEEGEKVRFRVVTEGEKIDFGEVFKLTSASLYSVFTQDTREKIKSSFSSVEESLEILLTDLDENRLPELGELLKKLEGVNELASKLQAQERERIAAQVLRYRRKLLDAVSTMLMFDFISREEEREIGDFYKDDKDQRDRALMAPGLFRYRTHEALKEELLSEGDLRGYSEVFKSMEDKVESMDSAMELMEFESRIEDALPKAKKYLDKIDSLLERLTRKAGQVASGLADEGVIDPHEIRSAVRSAFAEKLLLAELRTIFRSSEEFFSLRGALFELNKNMGNSNGTSAEAALKPYLRQKIAQAFEYSD
ncbi:hypothetical protein ACFLTS_01455 [Chloroflexota bacterium]